MDWVMVEIRGQRSPGCALEGSAVGLASGYTSWLFSRGRDFGPGAYLFVVLGTSTCLNSGETEMRFQVVSVEFDVNSPTTLDDIVS